MEILPTEAFSRAADALDGLLCALSDDDWRIPVLRCLDAQGVVGHLIGVEDDVHRCLSGDPRVADASHVESTQPAAARQAGRPATRTRTGWRRAAGRTLDLVRAAGDPCAEVAVHGMRLPLSALLAVRAFELWTHENDIRRAARVSSGPGLVAVIERAWHVASILAGRRRHPRRNHHGGTVRTARGRAGPCSRMRLGAH